MYNAMFENKIWGKKEKKKVGRKGDIQSYGICIA